MAREISGNEFDRRTLLCQVIQNWIRANRVVAEAWRGLDAPWWYNERASLSILAGAIWRSGYLAFEEYSDEKWLHRGPKRTTYTGRCDLYFELGHKGYVVEAKQGWSGGSSDHDVQKRIRKTLQAAHQAASRMSAGGRDQERLALAFIVPRFKPKRADSRDLDTMITRWLVKIREIPGWQKAWTFPAASRQLKATVDRSYCYPGVAIFVRSVPRALKSL